jgi:hypothetical protein
MTDHGSIFQNEADLNEIFSNIKRVREERLKEIQGTADTAEVESTCGGCGMPHSKCGCCYC